MFRKILTSSSLFLPLVSAYSLSCNQQYIWGNGIYQPRPSTLLQFHNYTPKAIANLPKAIQIFVFGQGVEIGIDDKGVMYCWDQQIIDSNQPQDSDNIRTNIKKIDSNVKQACFTKGYLWALHEDGKVYQWKIQQGKIIGSKNQVPPLRGTKQISTGKDHVLALRDNGEVFAMGDDTHGQCGIGAQGRNTCPPFVEKRITKPVKIEGLEDIVKIQAGGQHSLAIDRSGNVYGWGSNSSLQISHEEQFSKINNPLLCSYTPIRITKNLQNLKATGLAAGNDFTVVTGIDRASKQSQTYSFGNNLHGQLGLGQPGHFKDVQKIEKLSNFQTKIKGKTQKVVVDKIQCGRSHCLALLNVGYVMAWGHNEQGQLGNKKRSPSMAPFLHKFFMGKNVQGVFAGGVSSGAIVKEQEGQEGEQGHRG